MLNKKKRGSFTREELEMELVYSLLSLKNKNQMYLRNETNSCGYDYQQANLQANLMENKMEEHVEKQIINIKIEKGEDKCNCRSDQSRTKSGLGLGIGIGIGSVLESKNLKRKTNDLCEDRIGLEKVNLVLNKKPRVSWGERLHCFSEFNPNLIKGWNSDTLQNISQKKKIPKKLIIDKELFKIFAQLTSSPIKGKQRSKSYKSAQRGVTVFLNRLGYHCKEKYSRVRLVFILNKKI
ncbi:hypothetical protein M0812_04323 [Anaeramoeba flamelloides]|uniref:Uncharacterized protein n=1 Tax=Anaeramoeba flamelloides TaxID=1746091 RepID=A0AAV8AE38_9EUKA|nr:hypothetical protein M0812_04323 [Anaeramoeba flamelloides]|eukprot:Anaeramoba_flamelloidesa821128_69.p1 GENE.a821128_69~~a821128_69.p1  ORF type:complete len:237 (-),score=59.68 a821128_69:9-719(-)